MEGEISEADLEEKRDHITALDRENGQILSDITDLENKLELIKAKVKVIEERVPSKEKIFTTYAICILLLAISIALYLKC
jgi:chromosome segregation ATPase